MGLRRIGLMRRQPAADAVRSDVADGAITAMPAGGLAVLLRPDREVVRFTGRGEELDLLRAWGAADEPRSVRLVLGPSGVGKSRLAQQVAAEWEAGGAAWRSVAAGDEARAVAAARQTSTGRLLLVVDGAETRTGLASLLIGVVADPGPVRVLLVARSLGEWWDRLAEEAVPKARALLTAPPIRLDEALDATGSDAEVAAAAVPDFARALGVAEPDVVDVERAALRMPVLVLHAAALLAVVRAVAKPDRPATVAIDGGAVDRLLGWEAQYWRREAQAAGLPDDEVLISQVVAAATLTGVRTAAEAQSVLARLPHLSGEPQEQHARWAQWLAGLYPADPDGRLGLLQPEMLAETHVTRMLADDQVLTRALLRQLPPGQAEHALWMLANAGARHREAHAALAEALRYDLPHLAIPAAIVAIRGHPELADVLADALATGAAAPGELTQIALALPHPSPTLAEANLLATLRARESLPRDPPPDTAAEWDERAARMLAGLGRGHSVPSHADNAEEHGAAGVRTRRHRPVLAASLTSLAVRLFQIDRFYDAVAAERAAVDVYRGLASTDPGRYQPELASCLTNLGVWFSSLGRPADAVPPTTEAVSIFRELATSGSTRYRPDQATALTNLSIWQSELGQIADALTVQEEAVGIFRELTAAWPGRYRPELATALTNLGIWFSRAGRPAEAVPVEEEAVALRRELAAAEPDRFRADLATSLTNLGITYRELERPADALAPCKEVVVSYRELAAVDPDIYRPELARALVNLGAMYHELGRPGAGVMPVREAVAIRRRLADADPVGHQMSLAYSLETLASILSALGHQDEAAKASEEARTIASEADERAAAKVSEEPETTADVADHAPVGEPG